MRGTTLLRALLVVLLCGFTGLPSAMAQEGSGLATELADRDDRGFLTGLLEDSLGGDGRIVRIEGFSGALSSTATIARITVADEAGVWLSSKSCCSAGAGSGTSSSRFG